MPTRPLPPSCGSDAFRTRLFDDVVASRCRVCGKALTGRQARTCSPKCRVALHRQEQAKKQAERDQRVRTLLVEALRLLDGGRTP